MGETGNPEGHVTPQTSGNDFLCVMSVGVPYGTKELAEQVGCSDRTAKRRLDDLVEDGEIAVKKIGHTMAWYRPVE